MSKEKFPSIKASSAESPEHLERRNRGWKTLRSLALGASLLVNAGLLVDKTIEDYHVDEIRQTLEGKEGSNGGMLSFDINEKEGGDKGHFTIGKFEDRYVITGNFNRGTENVSVRFNLPKIHAIVTEIESLESSRSSPEVLWKLLDLAYYGEITIDKTQAGGERQDFTFGNPDDREKGPNPKSMGAATGGMTGVETVWPKGATHPTETKLTWGQVQEVAGMHEITPEDRAAAQ
jgi:hypothetical protein